MGTWVGRFVGEWVGRRDGGLVSGWALACWVGVDVVGGWEDRWVGGLWWMGRQLVSSSDENSEFSYWGSGIYGLQAVLFEAWGL